MPNDLTDHVSRRAFLAASAAAAGSAAALGGAAEQTRPRPVPTEVQMTTKPDARPRMKIAEMLPPIPGPLFRLVKQCGVDYAVGASRYLGRMDRRGDSGPDAAAAAAVAGEKGSPPWSFAALQRVKQIYDEAGFKVDVIEWRPPLGRAKLGLPGRDEEIDTVCELVRNMGKLGIGVWCYEWMVLGVLRTSSTIPGRGGALVTGYDNAQLKDLPLTKHGVVKDEQLWASLEYFLKRVLPVAEKAGVKLALHPDDPPLSPIRGVARIIRSVDAYQRAVDLVPSPANGICLCQGNFTLMTNDLPAVIRNFGKQKKIFFVHFRDVRGTPEKYVETFHDEGKTDMLECMRAYRDIGFDGVCRPDHVPTMEGDSNQKPGYSSVGRLYAIGYIRGLQEAVYREGRG
jgi:mannonate dehydratase